MDVAQMFQIEFSRNGPPLKLVESENGDPGFRFRQVGLGAETERILEHV